MRSFRDAPIKRKLTLVIVITSLAVLLAAGMALLAYERSRFQNEMAGRMSNLADIVGSNSAASLTFEDPKEAQRILGSLRGNEHIVAAAIYDKQGKLFASYPADKNFRLLPPQAVPLGNRLENDRLILSQPILLDNEQLGTVYIHSDLGELETRLKSYGAILVAILLGSVVLAFVLSSALQRLISEPILHLVDTVKTVAGSKDYSVRAVKHGADELGSLIDGFNEMLSQIQAREMALRESEEQFRAMFELAGVGKIQVDPVTARMVRVNRKMCEITGYSEKELLALKITQLGHPEDHERDAAAFNRMMAGDAPEYAVDMRYVRKDGRIIWVAVNATLLRDASGRPQRTVGVIQDITDRMKAEDEIRALNAGLEERVKERTAQLETANKELEAFSYSVSHDLRAPLRSIDGFSRIIQDRYSTNLDSSAKGYFDRVREATRRMGQLIDDMLMLSRVTRTEMKRDDVNLSEMAEGIIQELRQRDPQRNVEFVAAQGAVAKGDAHLLHIVLDNLLGNAWKYSGKREVAKIEFGLAHADGKSAYFVKDNGAGFDMAYAERLFNPFQRLHTSSEFPGSGIGLTIVHRIIQRHGGSMWVEAAVDKGAAIFFKL
jgi:PAS domain S-box-containing protein